MDKNILREIGLTDSEINVYLALLELGSTTTGPVVDKSGAASSKIYEILDRLMQKGLASYIIKAGKKYFDAAPPERILDYLKEKQQNLQKQAQAVEKILPSLQLKRKMANDKNEVTIYKGLEGIKTAHENFLKSMKTGDELVDFGLTEQPEAQTIYFNHFQKRREQKGVKFRQIMHPVASDEFEFRKKLPLTSLKFFSLDQTYPVGFEVCNDTTIFTVNEKDGISIVIENKQVADTFRSYFEKQWQQDVIVSKGADAFRDALLKAINELKGGDTYRVLGASFGEQGNEKNFADIFRQMHEKRIEKGIKAELLFYKGNAKSVEQYGQEFYEGKNAEIKFLPYGTDSPVEILPYADKTVMIIQEKEPIVITINNKKIADSFVRHFDSLWEQDTMLYNGIEGVKAVYDDTLNYKDVYFIGANWGIKHYFPDYWKEYNAKRIKGKVFWHDLIARQYDDKYYDKFQKQDAEVLRAQHFYEWRELPKEMASPHVIAIFGNKIASILWGKEPRISVVENKEIAASYLKYFKLLWDSAGNKTRVHHGREGPVLVLQEIIEAGKRGLPNYGFGTDTNPYWLYLRKDLEEFFAAEKKYTIKTKLLFMEGGEHKQPNADVRYLPKEFVSPVRIMVYDDKVAMVDFTEPWTTIILQKKEIALAYIKQFELLWKMAKP